MNRGFTIIETLLATALAAALMLAVLAVSGALARTENAMAQPRLDHDHEALVELISTDLRQAQQLKLNPDRIELTGHGGLTAGEAEGRLARRHRPVRVVYRLIEIDGASWLIREQTNLDGLTNRNSWRELVAPSVQAIEMIPIEPQRTSDNESSERATRAEAGVGNDETLPGCVQLVVTWTDPAQPPLSRLIFTH